MILVGYIGLRCTAT